MKFHPFVDFPLRLTESCSIHLTRELLGDQRTAELTDTLLTADGQLHFSRRHPNQSTELARAKSE